MSSDNLLMVADSDRDANMLYAVGSDGGVYTLKVVAKEIARRISTLFTPNEQGVLPCWGPNGERMAKDPHFRELIPFHEYFHADKGWGCGAEHQTGWTSLVIGCIGKWRAKK